MTMMERRREGDWSDDVTDVMTTPGKRITPAMQERIACARAAAEAVARELEDLAVPFDLSDVKRR